MQLTIYTIAYNEEFMMPYFIRHYRSLFPNCVIVVFDNESTDRTKEIVNSFPNTHCVTYFSNGKLNDSVYLDIKNHCWKEAQSDWVLVCDVDEHLNISESDLIKEDQKGVTIIQGVTYNMVGTEQDESKINVDEIRFGIREPFYDKFFLFNKNFVREILYTPGCHHAFPKGHRIVVNQSYKCFHYKFIHPDYMVRRYQLFNSRLSEINKQKGYGVQYQYSEERIRKEFEEAKLKAHEVR